MSVATDLAELNAAIHENELDTEEAERLRELVQEDTPLAQALELVLGDREGAEPTPTPPAPAEEQASEPSEKQLRALDRETTRHIESVHRIMGGFVAGFTPCSKCDGLGLEQPGPDPREHPYFKTCETCAGFGQVLTGSLREGRTARDCPACGGNGYLEALGAGGIPLATGYGGQQAPPPPFPPAPVAVEAVAPQEGTGGLTFGRPEWMGDPSIGA